MEEQMGTDKEQVLQLHRFSLPYPHLEEEKIHQAEVLQVNPPIQEIHPPVEK